MNGIYSRELGWDHWGQKYKAEEELQTSEPGEAGEGAVGIAAEKPGGVVPSIQEQTVFQEDVAHP